MSKLIDVVVSGTSSKVVNRCEFGVYEHSKGKVHCSLDSEICYQVQDDGVRTNAEGQVRCDSYIGKVNKDVRKMGVIPDG